MDEIEDVVVAIPGAGEEGVLIVGVNIEEWRRRR